MYITLFLRLFSIILFTSCNLQGPQAIPEEVSLEIQGKVKLRTRLALSAKQQERGLSGIKATDFAQDQAMLFLGKRPKARQFWMPDTYFDLDLFFLDKNLSVVDIHRSLKAHPGRRTPPPIQRSKTVYCLHVLELRSDSPLAKKIKHGDRFIFNSPVDLEEIQSRTRLQQ